jgi:hypothetical protein
MPGTREAGHKLLEFAASDDDLSLLRVAALVGKVKNREDDRTEHKEVQQGFAEEFA